MEKQAKIYVVTGKQDFQPNEYIDEVISFEAEITSQIALTYQLTVAADIISQEYAHYLKKK